MLSCWPCLDFRLSISQFLSPVSSL
jgi:hypothetical protein